MKFKVIFFLFIGWIVLGGCSQGLPLSLGLGATATPVVPTTVEPTKTLPAGQVKVTRVPDPQETAALFLENWKAEKYSDMFSLLTRLSHDALSSENFEKRYRSVAVNMTLQTIDYKILSALVNNPTNAQVAYRVTYKTSLFQSLEREMVMKLTLENGAWRVQWEDALILPELRDGYALAIEYKIPARGDIYDRNGSAIAAQAEAVALGVIPGQIDPEKEKTLLEKLAGLTGQDKDYIKGLYKNANPTWYIPVGEASTEAVQAEYNTLTGLPGLVMNSFRSRYYYENGIASQTIGYMLAIPKEQLEEYQRKGYRGDEKVGADGLENWGESYLAGKPEVNLYVKDGNGQVITRLSRADAVPAQSLYTTLDKDLQVKLQKSFGDQRGSAIVMEMKTGRILAMVSSPGFDPNLFEPTNYNYGILLNQVLNDDAKPLYNRAAQGVYPLGSVFKIITMSAALESKLYTTASRLMCGFTFTELGGLTLYDWTYTHKVPASGDLSLPEGLMRSCNIWFWHIGLDLYRQGHNEDVSKLARAFGLGAPTGIGQVSEQTGNLPDPTSDSEAVNLAIGQGTTLVTPLQVVSFMAAVGNGGTLYLPQLVEKIASPDGVPSFTFTPTERGKLPISADTLAAVQEALRSVVTDKRGTAHWVLANMDIPVAGKTGTAQTPNGNSHAWFAGYSLQNDPKKPDIAVVVMLENGGEGSEVAAPIFRRAVSLYFSDNTIWDILMPWESKPYVAATPTPLVTDTPVAAETQTPTPAP